MLDVKRSRELQAVILGLKQADRELVRDINKDARQQLKSEWLAALRGNASHPLDERVLIRGARVAVSSRQVAVKAATSKRRLSGGLIPADSWQGVEFGMRNRRQQITTTSRRGRRYTVTRTIGSQFPSRQRHGRVVFDAASKAGTRLVGIWVNTIVDKFREFAEVKAR